ncbi:M15 family metallopeptidase [Streptomyces sp. NBC_00249]|uniref:M15 family metallopeptidase n=1 Tax=Streptomyces sp. NBC_00249 TaxID=2975690 RepID=UPI002254562D|nr:M15 family metallopeptidase [Streptomyces sp. NBC_00249]MCX5195584.1 M15 family metallopeptidase [Streptomyces sp. NBC_00249]
MRYRLAAVALSAALCVSMSSCAVPEASAPVFRAVPGDLTAELAVRVSAVPAGKLGAGHGPGCPVPAGLLRLVRMNHWGFDGKVHQGELIVHRDAVDPLLHVFAEAFEARFPIRRMRVTAEYGGSDARAMAHDNTSAFNCRQVTGDPRRQSRHAWGDAVDINPVENPYVDRYGVIHPPDGRAHLDRDRSGPGVIRPGDVVTRAFEEVGWSWGGEWSPPDYQHFSANGA